MTKKVVFLGMGGTIGGLATSAQDNVGYTAAQVEIDALLGAIPALESALHGHRLWHEQVAQLDSKDLDLVDCAVLSERVSHYLAQDDVCGVIITHGTDTLEETSFFLHETLPPDLLASKPVALTCAMRPSSSLYPDGPQNILEAVAVVMSAGACGVLVTCAGVVYAGEEVEKIHPYRLSAFDAGEAAPIGYVEEGRLRQVRPWPSPSHFSARFSGALLSTWTWPRVEIVMNYVGANGMMVNALCAERAGHARVEGIVAAGTGNGTLHHSLETALREVAMQGVCVVRTSRCRQGQIVTAADGVAYLPVARHASPIKARIALMLDLGAKKMAT